MIDVPSPRPDADQGAVVGGLLAEDGTATGAELGTDLRLTTVAVLGALEPVGRAPAHSRPQTTPAGMACLRTLGLTGRRGPAAPG